MISVNIHRAASQEKSVRFYSAPSVSYVTIEQRGAEVTIFADASKADILKEIAVNLEKLFSKGTDK